MTSRRDFIRRGMLWTLGAAILGPEALERLTWRRKHFALGELPDFPYVGAIQYEAGNGWLSAEFKGSILELKADAWQLEPGSYYATVPVIGASSDTQQVTVRFDLCPV